GWLWATNAPEQRLSHLCKTLLSRPDERLWLRRGEKEPIIGCTDTASKPADYWQVLVEWKSVASKEEAET
ncbi:MAG: hypothetical protein ACRDHW_12950, partial [Ktedonobacteraceae bacterium]